MPCRCNASLLTSSGRQAWPPIPVRHRSCRPEKWRQQGAGAGSTVLWPAPDKLQRPQFPHRASYYSSTAGDVGQPNKDAGSLEIRRIQRTHPLCSPDLYPVNNRHQGWYSTLFCGSGGFSEISYINMSTSYYVVMFHHSVKVVRKISRSGMTSMPRYSRQWFFGLQGHCKKTNALRGAQNYNTGFEGAPTLDTPLLFILFLKQSLFSFFMWCVLH